MADSPEDPAASPDANPAETPLQRALRLKKAAHQAKARSTTAAAGQRRLERAAAAKASAKSKPWMAR